jgi:hypothetical protein
LASKAEAYIIMAPLYFAYSNLVLDETSHPERSPSASTTKSTLTILHSRKTHWSSPHYHQASETVCRKQFSPLSFHTPPTTPLSKRTALIL